MEGESTNVLSEPDFLKEKIKIKEEERKLEAAIEEIEKQCAIVTDELKELETKSSTSFGELEERYWNEFNYFQFQLTAHQDESDAVLAKTEVKRAQFELVKRTSFPYGAFPIGHDKEFGTINNFRLGRFQTVTVEWDETNAAWGQACLLLHTMTQYFRPKFLFGPVNMFRTLFLTCLKDFSEFANYIDKVNKISKDECFNLPYKIENDKVGVFSIIYKKNSTKALRYMVCNLKLVLDWFIGNAKFSLRSSLFVLSRARISNM